jgi:UDPglucose 6-dehydrogenase
MRLTMIGTGYVGLVSGTCFSEFGHDVTCVDIDPKRIETLEAGRIPIFEPGLEDLVRRNVEAGRLHFTGDIAKGVAGADAVFIAVGTPSRRGDGHADLSYVYEAARQIAAVVTGPCVIVNKSTVPVGTARAVEKIVADTGAAYPIEIASNPEFLREGSAINDFTHPDRVVCGVNSERARQVMREIYRPLFLRETPIFFTNWESAELIKYAANSFLAVKIGFINEMADLCEKVGANVQDLAKGIGMDKRIGDKFLNPGPGYGGSCFPKDTLALLKTSQDYGAPVSIVEATVSANDERKKAMAAKVIAECGGDVSGKTIGVLGLTFKPNTDDMRDAPSLVIVPELIKAGAKVKVFDPEGRHQAEPMLPGVEFVPGPYEVAADAAAVVLLTEWNEFRALDLARVRDSMATPIFVDLRNVYRPDEMHELGFKYSSVGRM